jgi:AcrR family transcriptional regulator
MSPRTEKQNSEIRKYRENVILSSALELFSQKGYLGASMDSIAMKAKVSKGNLYNYFESKDELLEAVLTKGMQQFVELLDSYPAELITSRDFEDAIRGNFEVVKSNSEYWKLYFNILTQPQAQQLFQKIFAPLLEKYMKIFEGYFRRKGDENPLATSMLLGSTLDGVSLGYIFMGDIYPLDNVLDELINRFK